MQVRGLSINWNKVPAEVEPFISSKQTFITPGEKYSVHALSIYNKVLFVLVIDDLNTPVFVPVWLFEIISTDIPDDWICNLKASSEVEMILGPEFLARDIESYNSMVDQESEKLEQLWFWLKSKEQTNK